MRSISRQLRFLAILFVGMPLSTLAQSATGVSVADRVGHWYFSGAIGGYQEESNSQLNNQQGKFGTAISGGYRLTPNLALEADLLYSRQDIDTPASVAAVFPGGVDSRSSLHSAGLGGVVKFILPFDRVELYAGAGIGVYSTSFHAEGTAFGATTSLDDNDRNVGYQGMLGVDVYVIPALSVGLEYRKLKLDADLGPITSGKIDAGGDFLFLTVRGHF
jgi:opacity protein-like surface antigen